MILQAVQVSSRQFSGPGREAKSAGTTADSAFGAVLTQQSQEGLQVSGNVERPRSNEFGSDLQVSSLPKKQPEADGSLEVSDAYSALSEAAGLQFFYLQPPNLTTESGDSAGSGDAAFMSGFSLTQGSAPFLQAVQAPETQLLSGLPADTVSLAETADPVFPDAAQPEAQNRGFLSDAGVTVMPAAPENIQNRGNLPNATVLPAELLDISQGDSAASSFTNVIVQLAETAEPETTGVLPEAMKAETGQPVLTKGEGDAGPEGELLFKTAENAAQAPAETAALTEEHSEKNFGQSLLSEKEGGGASKREAEPELSAKDVPQESVFERLGFSRGVIQVADASSRLDKAPVHQVADQVRLLIDKNRSEYELQLSPESLGRVSVRLSMNDGVMTVVLAAQSPKTQELLRAGSDEIASLLKESGAARAEVAVTVSQPDQSSNQQTAYQEQESSGRQNAYYQQRQTDKDNRSADFEAMLLDLKMEEITQTAL